MLYLFCGQKRKADIKHFLQRFGSQSNFQVTIREVDIERSSADDLLQQSLWDELLKEIDAGHWDVVVLTPPCNTFSRARCNFQASPGPVPIRNFQHPWGFPWLTGANFRLIQDHNYLLTQCILTMQHCISSSTDFLFEHPEDLGVTTSGERPASVWQLEEMRAFVVNGNACTFAIYQCNFGAESPKPTRLMTSLSQALSFPFQGFPTFSSQGHYEGPLPSDCTHSYHEKQLIGKSDGAWRTAASAAYPPGLCKWLASLIVSRMGQAFSEAEAMTMKEKNLGSTSYTDQQDMTDNTGSDDTGSHVPGAASTDVDMEVVKFKQLHRGQQISLEWAGKHRPMVDGFGLCSPTLWEPKSRGAHLDPKGKDLCDRLYGLFSDFIGKKFDDPGREAVKLGLGKIEGSPFHSSELSHLRQSWAKILPSERLALEVPDRQPFLLGMIGQSLEVLGDPDAGVYTDGLDSFWTGVPVGYDNPLPRVPAVFPKKEKVRPLDESEYNNLAENYRSARDMADDLERKFREEEALGRMIPTTLGELKSKHPDRTPLVAAMGAIRKPNGDVRPLHDGTHFVQLNNNILFQDQLQYPGPEDAASMVRWVREEKESVFSMSADIQAAHRLVKIREQDWPLQACKARSDDKTVWINTVGTFGVSSASYWWTRLFSGIGRLVGYILNQQNWFQLVYVDDLHLTCMGKRKFLNLWVILLIYELLGTPFSYKKFAGGLQVQFVGYYLDYRGCLLGITKRRGDWLINFIDELAKSGGTIYMRRFNEFLGRLGFVARVLTWLKPFLAPLYAWSAALDRSTVATAPRLVLLVLRFLKGQLCDRTYMHTCVKPEVLQGEQFRTDAKCEVGRVVLGGHCVNDGRWFSLELTPAQAPFLFKPSGESQWASTTAELLAVLVALRLFGFLEPSTKGKTMPLYVAAGTDNLANEHLIRKGLTTKWPLCLVFMQLTVFLMGSQTHVQLNWRPRDENTFADDLTNGKFDDFKPDLRVACKWEELHFDLIETLWKERLAYLDRDLLKKEAVQTNLGPFEKSNW